MTISPCLIRFVPESAWNHAGTDETVPLLLAARARTHTGHQYHRTLQLAIALCVPLIEDNILTVYERLAKNRASGFVTKDKACKYMKQYIYKYIFYKHRYDMCI